ncbi:hypothetical protein DMI70_09565 [Escherichia coli]|nr:hypothetical protein [Escherichia coli]
MVCSKAMIFYVSLPPELATLGITELEYEFYRRLVENSCLPIACTVSRGVKMIERPVVHKDYDEQPRGPFIVCVDTSGSMGGFNEQCAKAFCPAFDAHSLAETGAAILCYFPPRSSVMSFQGHKVLSKRSAFKSAVSWRHRSCQLFSRHYGTLAKQGMV